MIRSDLVKLICIAAKIERPGWADCTAGYLFSHFGVAERKRWFHFVVNRVKKKSDANLRLHKQKESPFSLKFRIVVKKVPQYTCVKITVT